MDLELHWIWSCTGSGAALECGAALEPHWIWSWNAALECGAGMLCWNAALHWSALDLELHWSRTGSGTALHLEVH